MPLSTPHKQSRYQRTANHHAETRTCMFCILCDTWHTTCTRFMLNIQGIMGGPSQAYCLAYVGTRKVTICIPWSKDTIFSFPEGSWALSVIGGYGVPTDVSAVNLQPCRHSENILGPTEGLMCRRWQLLCL